MLIASRNLNLRDGETLRKIPIRLFLPVRLGSGTWTCRYEVGWPERPSVNEGSGVDAIQAITVALRIVGAEIYTSSYHKAGILYLDAVGQGYGFPVPHAIRDLLVGDDAKYF